MLATLLIYLVAGAAAGLVAGLFGLGGGAVIVPVLVFAYAFQGLPDVILMQMAVATSLAIIVVTSLSSIRAHWKLGGVLWATFARMAPGIALGAITGAWLGHRLPSEVLQSVFGVFLLTVAVQMLLSLRPRPRDRTLPGAAGLAGAGGVIGAMSSLVGIGGGTMTVPFLTWFGVQMRQAVGTSAACGLPIALFGSAAFMVSGYGHPELPPWTTGYVYWPAVVGIAVASVLVAPFGARLAHRLPQEVVRRAFALFLVVVALRLLLS